MDQAIQIITEAIQKRKPIEFEYVKDGKVRGKRIGDPHIIFSGEDSSGVQKTWVHLVQTGGVSDSDITFPEWRMFITTFMQNVVTLGERPPFEIFDGYNPDAPKYIGTAIHARV